MIQFINDKDSLLFKDEDIVQTETEGTFLFFTLNNPLSQNDLYSIQKSNKCYINQIEYNYKYHIYGREISNQHNSLLYNLGIQLLD